MTMTRAVWEADYHKVFVDLCVEIKKFGNLPRMQHILEPFLKKTGARFTIVHLKNHWDTMLKQWKVWCRLVQSTDMKWDPQTNTFGASNQDWANYLKVNPEAGQYRLKHPPLYLEKLEIIYQGMNLDGEGTSSSGSKRKRRCVHVHRGHAVAKWSTYSHSIFVELCYQESLKVKGPIRRNGYYSKATWTTLFETIKQATGLGYTNVQLRNHWEITRQAWKLWCRTIAAPILKWDPITRSFGATEEDWANYLKENGTARAFRYEHIPHAEKLATIFKGRNVNTRPYRKRMNHHHSQSLHLHEPAPTSAISTNEPFTGIDDSADDDDEPTPLIWLDSDSEDVETVTPGSHRFNTKLVEKISVDASAKKKEYTIAECMECLDAMEEVEIGSNIYMFALDLFLRKEHREIFLLLKTSSLRMSWLLQRRFGVPAIAA